MVVEQIRKTAGEAKTAPKARRTVIRRPQGL